MKNHWSDWLFVILNALIMIGVAGLFVNGTMMSSLFLGWIPLLAHKVLGWIILVLTVIGVIGQFTK